MLPAGMYRYIDGRSVKAAIAGFASTLLLLGAIHSIPPPGYQWSGGLICPVGGGDLCLGGGEIEPHYLIIAVIVAVVIFALMRAIRPKDEPLPEL